MILGEIDRASWVSNLDIGPASARSPEARLSPPRRMGLAELPFGTYTGLTYVIGPNLEACRQMSCRIRKGAPRGARADDLAGRLYEWRRKNDFSQSEAALKLKISTRTLQEWEQNRAHPQGLALTAVSQAIRF